MKNSINFYNVSNVYLCKLLKIVVFSFITILLTQSCKTNQEREKEGLTKIAFENIEIVNSDELAIRASKNYDRLETDIFYPENVFQKNYNWPGDIEGRTILGLVMQAQATHREPLYLNEMIKIFPSKLNEKGYFGPIQGDTIDEQQLSGHGWLLRGLCEYYIWKQDTKVKKYIQDIIQNLALPTKGFHKNYPITNEGRRKNVGEMLGTTQNVVNNWLLSSDIGCDYIFLDGLVQTYSLFPSKELKELIDEIVTRYLEIDLKTIEAQMHATLTGLRGIARYYEITGNKNLLIEVEKRYKLYREYGMTENYENFGWFGRPVWTEPCAIIDSYMLAVQLWQYTQNPKYIEDAHHIYYNAICHTQRSNGGFGCDNCPGPKDLHLSVKFQEAYWCCTMRGGEGLAKAFQYSYFTEGNSLYVPFYHNSKASFKIGDKIYSINQSTSYPFGTKASFIITPKVGTLKINLNLFVPSWITNPQILVNGEKVDFLKINSFISLPLKIDSEINVEFTFEMCAQIREAVNPYYTQKGRYAVGYGPLVLGYEGDKAEISFKNRPEVSRIDATHWRVTDGNENYVFTPIYHLLDEKVKEKIYQKQILF